ncbi:hypothetical protein C2G38_2164347 [Gigaspora rosea]|uniref:Uncharacterized protein n=1 Tax=Gigaspora rosea TaxID=44941 RepID=A0A397W3Y0_9GLOM|nr:hypothetical protein C2G38_2164347 [Gigaspora rosea]
MRGKKLKIILNQIAVNTGINLADDQKITNHSTRCTVITLLKQSNVPKDEAMVSSGHRSQEEICIYCDPSYNQRLASIALLIPFVLQEQDLNKFELDYVNNNQQECSHGSTIEDTHDLTIEDFHNSTIEDSHNSTIEDLHDLTIEVLQDLKNLVGAPYLQDSNFKEQNSQNSTQKDILFHKNRITLQKKKRAAPYIDDSNSKVFKLFKISTDDSEKLNYTKYHPRMPLRKATNNIILQLPKTDKPINITLNLLINN